MIGLLWHKHYSIEGCYEADTNRDRVDRKMGDGGRPVRGDATCERIEWLVSSYLEKIASSNWETLFRDPIGRELLEAAHGICPYSKATHGNMEVSTNLL